MPKPITKTNNYDLNIWDEASWLSNGEDTDGWRIDVYKIVSKFEESEEGGDWVFQFYGSGPQLENHSIYLTPSESKELTLGWEKELGGYYTPDSDFWLDKDTFMNIYKTIPARVASLLWALPEYEVEGTRIPEGSTTV